MISEQAAELGKFYDGWNQQMAKGMHLQGMRKLFDTFGDLAAEPEGVEFSDLTVGGVECIRAVPKGTEDQKKVLLCMHGGGFIACSAESHRKVYGHIAKAAGCKALILDFTLAPKNAHPGILMEAMAVYAGILELGYKPEDIATIGDSAGGNLAAAVVLYAQQLGYPQPAACVGLCPFFDMACTGESLITNADKDGLITKDVLTFMATMFLGGKSPTGPLANPLHANLKGFPPTLLQVGSHEGLLDDSRKFYEKAKAEGVDVELQIFPEMQHIFHGMAGKAPEADEAIAKVGRWLRAKLRIA
jgi:monoterpene epsilon-lactone hydrolase